VLPLARDAFTRADTNPSAVELLLLPGADGTRELVEDDGTGERVSRTTLTWDDAGRTLTVGAASDPSVVPARRDWTVRFLGVSRVDDVEVSGGGEAVAGDGVVTVAGAPADVELRIRVRFGAAPGDRQSRLFDLLSRAQWEHERKQAAWDVLTTDAEDLRKVSGLQALGMPESLLSALIEILVSGPA
jgi:hypothetical protein